MLASTNEARIGIVVDAGPRLGYGHAVRCLRLARALEEPVAIYALSDECRAFFESHGFACTSGYPRPGMFPSLVITDLREINSFTASIRNQGSTHVSIHDLGLSQCDSDVAIDGSIVQLFPFPENKRTLLLGPSYMITRPPVARDTHQNSIFVTLGGGVSAQAAEAIVESLEPLGLPIVTTPGFASGARMTDAEIEFAMATCSLAISASGTSLYDLLASGIPTIAVAVDRLQLRTADAFHELGAVVSAGLMDTVSPSRLRRLCQEILSNSSLSGLMAATGQSLVDGNGLFRVVEIIRREVCLMEQNLSAKTFTVC